MFLFLALACDGPDDTGLRDTGLQETGLQETGLPDTDTPDTDTAAPVIDTGAWPSTGLPACDGQERDTAGGLPDCVETLAWSPQCDRAPGALSRAGLLWAGLTAEFVLLGGSTLTVTDADTWDRVVAGWPGEDKPAMSVDFSTHVVVIVQDSQSSTCGLAFTSHGVHAPDGAPPTVYARFTDEYGACASQCDMAQQAIVVYAVPFGDGYPVLCAEEIDRCP